MSTIQQIESLSKLIIPDGVAETLQNNIGSQFGLDISLNEVEPLIEIVRKDLALRISCLVAAHATNRPSNIS
ncbi:MAG TPA: hypothetical protein V6D33_12595 [Cyanophyceae cyanobacterium]